MLEPVEYRPSLAKTFGYLLGFSLASAAGAWIALKPGASSIDRFVGLLGAGLFGLIVLTVLVATIRFRAYLRLDERGVRMVDRFGRPRLDVPWSSVANAYEADTARHNVVVLVASDTPANLRDGLAPPLSLTGPDGESLGYGYVIDPSIVDVRPPDLIGEVQRRLQDRLGEWDPHEGATRRIK